MRSQSIPGRPHGDPGSDLSRIFTFVEYNLLRIRTFVFGLKMKFGPREKGVGSSQTLLATCTVLHRNQWEIFHDG